MKIKIKILEEQIAYLKSLDSKKKKRKFLLDCLVGEIEFKGIHALIEEFFSTENILKTNREAMGLPTKKIKVENVVDEKLKGTGYENAFFKAIIPIGSSFSDVLKEVDKYKESQEILEKSKEPQPPTEFCVKVTDENRDVLQGVWNNKRNFNNVLSGNYLVSDSLFSSCKSSLNKIANLPIVTTEEFLKYIGREDLIEKDELLKFNNLEEPLPYCVKVVESNARILTDLYNSIKSMKVKEIPSGMWLICDSGNLEVINSPYKIVDTSEFLKYYNTVKDLL